MPSLTSNGTPVFNGDSTCTINNVDDGFTAPASLVDETQVWFAARFKVGFNATDAGADQRFVNWQDDGTHVLELAYSIVNDRWEMRRGNGAVTVAGSAAQTFIVNDVLTVIGAATATQLKVSVNGGAFTAAANTSIPTLLVSTFVLCNRSDFVRDANSTFYWMAVGAGTLSDADAVTIHGFGNTDPNFPLIPGTPKFIWRCDDTSYLVPSASVFRPKHRNHLVNR